MLGRRGIENALYCSDTQSGFLGNLAGGLLLMLWACPTAVFETGTTLCRSSLPRFNQFRVPPDMRVALVLGQFDTLQYIRLVGTGPGIGSGQLNWHEVYVTEGRDMQRPYTLYMDETGNRHPDKKSDASRKGRDWFGFGGILVRGEDNNAVRELVSAFSQKWKLRKPAHITDMLSENKGFSWLGRKSQHVRDEFWDDWRGVLCTSPVIGIGCVIDRPGYVARGYLEEYNDKWLLCRSAFDITVERAAKIARLEQRKLHVVFEQDPAVNEIVTNYFRNLKSNGMGFSAKSSEKYNPLGVSDFQETLGRIQHKPKNHPLLQVADSYIYSISRWRYDKKFWLYRSLRDSRRIADFALSREHLPHLGIKYYCFDPKTKKPG
ncbi:DUF3800 domain-containing protein [Microbaculum marinisediminis]|uniref:DUF3800 domain-containing protein n=1 Tax=Microbaculum marinisediminis TaxID=2931392 RepID=A0AAW5QX19_9HYPH|nr:DUF3800 domain-containing protein [Microbaculum sp. A6E488]MCT8970879.1 DUF3800 domain-containing protein [Microbaculum sp. A6E488]